MSRLTAAALLLLTAILQFTAFAEEALEPRAPVPAGYVSPSYYPAPNGGWAADWAESYRKAIALVSNLTLAEKVNITTGSGFNAGRCAGNTGSILRIGFRQQCLQDGPLGVRSTDNITVFPAGITIGATFDKDLMYRRGVAMGEEFRGKGVNYHLGPSVGPLGRKPRGGRNWEGFGSDPVLQGIAGAENIRGVQSQGVIATVKHLIANEQEVRRANFLLEDAYSANADDRTLHELYLWPFADAVHAGVGAVMTAYNDVNGSATSQNAWLINNLLKEELGFHGVVMTDWFAHQSGVASSLAGLDMSMPGDGPGLIRGGPSFGTSYWGYELTRAALNGSVPMSRIDDMATRILATWIQMGQDKDYPPPNFSASSTKREDKLYPFLLFSPTSIVNEFVNVQANHKDVAREVAQDAITLLKNTNATLPLPAPSSSLAGKLKIFGDDARTNPDGINSCGDFKQCNKGTLGQGWGSGTANYPYFDSPLDALRRRVANISYYPDRTFPSNTSPQPNDVAIVFINSNSGENLPGQPVEGQLGDKTRTGLSAWYGGDKLVQDVAAAYSTVIVVIHTTGPLILEPWISLPSVKAVLNAHLPGQEAGESLIRVLFGDVSPSGHLPYTIARREEDYGDSVRINEFFLDPKPQDTYTEGLYIDYRYLNSRNITPRYPFGYGLSYTTFSLSSSSTTLSLTSPLSQYPPPPPPKPSFPGSSSASPQIRPSPSEAVKPSTFNQLPGYIYSFLSPLDASAAAAAYSNTSYPYPPGYSIVQKTSHPPAGGSPGGNPTLFDTIFTLRTTVTNSGSRPGRAVVQAYVAYPSTIGVPVPPLQLRDFTKTRLLSPGETESLELRINRKGLSIWDTGAQNWRAGAGGEGYVVWVGFSSAELFVRCTISGCEEGAGPGNFEI